MNTKRKVDPRANATFIKVSESDGVIIGVEARFEVWVGEKEQHERFFNFIIPAFDIHFVAESEQEGKEMVKVAVDGFFDYWIKDRSIYDFFNKIEKLGFKKQAPQIVNRRKVNKFSLTLPSLPLNRGHFELGKQTYKLAS